MFDSGSFKRTGGSCGHEAGDVMLRDVAERLAASLRQRDDVCR
nr:diguanylate cyclase [Siccirubricoccus soli]